MPRILSFFFALAALSLVLTGACTTLSGPAGTDPWAESAAYSDPAYEDRVDIVQIAGPRASAPPTVPTGSAADPRPPSRLEAPGGTRPPPPQRSPEPGERVHVVQPGDNLYRIGVTYGVAAEAIVAANGLSDNVIRPGQRLVIPR